MDLYFSPFASSLACRIVAHEAGIPLHLIHVKLPGRQLQDGTSYENVAPKGHLPALRLDDGSLLTECSAILQALAGLAHSDRLLPRQGTVAHVHTLEWLTFIATELHKQCLYPLFSGGVPDAVKAWARELLGRKLQVAAARLEQHRFLAADRFTVADAYLCWALMLCELGRIELPASLRAYLQQLRERPAVAACVTHERHLLGGGA
jgi:glutathione S-transferase